MVGSQQLLVLKLKMQDALIFLVQLVSTFLGNNPNKSLYINKVQSLSFPMISISILH